MVTQEERKKQTTEFKQKIEELCGNYNPEVVIATLAAFYFGLTYEVFRRDEEDTRRYIHKTMDIVLKILEAKKDE